MKRHIATIVLASTALLVTLTSCARRSASQNSNKTQISMMSFNQLREFESLVESTYPNIDLVVEQNAIATLDNESERRLKNGHGSDIIFTTMPGSSVKDYTYDISAERFTLNYNSSATKRLSIDGQTRFIPLPGNYYGYVVNETLVKELGFELPGTNRDIYDILEAAKSQQKGVGTEGDSIGFYDIGEHYLANVIFGNYVPDFLSTPEGIIWLEELQEGKAKFTGTFEPAMDFLIACIDKGYFNSGTVLSGSSVTISNKNAVDVYERMKDRTMVMAYGNNELYSKLSELNDGDKFVMLPFLSNEDRPGWVMSIGNGYLAINKNLAEDGKKDKLEAALKVLGLLSTQEGQQAWIDDTGSAVSYLNDWENTSGNIPEGIYDTVRSRNVFTYDLPYNITQYFGRQIAMAISGTTTLSEALAAVDNYNRTGFKTEEQSSTVIGSVADDMIYQNYNTRKEETSIGNLIADAVKDYSGAEIAFVNGGSIRSSLYKGEVWDADLAAVSPYGNLIITVRAKGSVLKEALANGITQTNRGETLPGGRFLQVSGICYSYRPMKDENDVGEIISVTLPDGTAIDDDKKYLVAITDYMAGSATYADGNGDGYVMFNVFDANTPKNVELVTETGGTFRDALKAYFEKQNGKAVSAPLQGRITIVK